MKCEICGDDTGPFLETHALIAALNGDEDHARELLAGSTGFELTQLGDAALELVRLADELRG